MYDANFETGELFIYDEIGPAWMGMVGAETVAESLSHMSGRRVTVRLNTPGGSVDEGIAIFNALKRHPGGVDVIVDSLAASMGSYLLQAGVRRAIANNSMVMIHDPWSIAMGNAEELRKEADILDKYRDRMVPEYANRSSKTVAEIEELLSAETWMVGQEIIDMGFADEMEGEAVEPVKIAKGRYRNTPKSILRDVLPGSKTPYPMRREAAKLRARSMKTA